MTYRDDVAVAQMELREGGYDEALRMLRATARRYPVPFIWENLRALRRNFRSLQYWQGLFLVIRKERK